MGGAKCLATPEQESEREFVVEQIRKSMRLHGTDRVVLMVHSDCGAYGGLARFRGDEEAEARYHQANCGARQNTCGRAFLGSLYCATSSNDKWKLRWTRKPPQDSQDIELHSFS